MPFRPSNAYLAIGKETVPGTAVTPTFAVPYAPSSLAGMEDVITPLRDESFRGIDSVVKGVSQGKRWTAPVWNANVYMEVLGYLFRAIIGPDTITGTGPYVHTFAQALTQPPSYTLLDWDQVEPRVTPGCLLDEFTIKIDPKGFITYDVKWMGYPSAIAITPPAPGSLPTVTDSPIGAIVTGTIGGTSVTNILSADLTFKRGTEAVLAADGTVGPRNIFAGPLDVTGKIKTIYEARTADYNDFLTNTQSAVQLNLSVGAQTCSLRMSKAARLNGTKQRGAKWLEYDFDIDAVHNTTDAGLLVATLTNTAATAY